ncbi:hypothetical protein BU14_0523s0014 [Porphyra umbilicalis]|uniref:dihydrolipoyllysine-residue succinyltransferase n=1 Tax=Porphyra umbilicalis TaxID=2786 RepID=A0A1X6NSJ6_PORUM|nr:hypothetical protein BU14_0523s0014 [Porphyra umbilicalis]|eukprot:OSX71547.1 hypothetical protein BU14_0523s0014 [Porphyra umbilicalis]
MRSVAGLRGLSAIARSAGRSPARPLVGAARSRGGGVAALASPAGCRAGLAIAVDGPRVAAVGRSAAATAASAAATARPRSLSVAAGPEDTLTVPEMGESITEGTVAAWLVEDGQAVEEDEIVVQIETDKVTVDVRAPSAGLLVKQKAEVGETVAVGQPLAVLRLGAAAAAEAAPAKAAAPEADDAPAAAPEAATPAEPVHGAKAAPGSKEAVPSPPQQQINLSESGERRVKMTRMRKRIADRLKEAQNTAAMLTTFNEVDMSALIDLRNEYKEAFEKRHGVKLGFMSPFIKAATVALEEQPEVNAFIDGDDIVYRDYVDVSVAVSTPTGLVVPVLRSCEKMSFAEIEKTIANLGTRAREGKLGIDDMQGGTFTISNGGVFGSLLSTPIINMPQSAILGMHIIQKRAMVIGNEIQIRPMMYLALSYDHRLIDGREAVTFLRRMKRLVEDPRRLLLEVDV